MLTEASNDVFVNLVHSTFASSVRNSLGAPSKTSIFMNPTNENEILGILSAINNSKSCDVEGFQIKPMKFVADMFAPVLSDIFNLSLARGIFPKEMQKAKVVFMYKSEDKNNFLTYRPISILPIFSKVLEKVIHVRLNSFCELHSVITPSQYGFRNGRSTELALLAQKEYILESFESKLLMVGVFLDFHKALDQINHELLISELEYYDIRGVASHLIKSYLSYRTQAVFISGTQSEFRSITSGVPQGQHTRPSTL